MAEYELVRQIRNQCPNNQMRDVFFEEVETDDPEGYVRSLLKGKDVVAGIVYNPYLDELFSATKGQGAFCNGEKISVSSQPMGKALVLFGTSLYDKDLFPKTIEVLSKYFNQALDIRRSGSAALDLCTVACGRAELYFELQVSPWDFAAGKLIVEEAGGVVTTIDGEPLSFDGKTTILAKNNVI